jgi:alpha-ribazole phosphatase/probable phosphoglycerate mutase
VNGYRPTRLVLIRHADPSDDVRGRCFGSLDVPLAPRGERRARHVAAMLRRLPIAAVYSSPSRRALETARPVAAVQRLTPVEQDDISEINFGILEGLTFDEIATAHQRLFQSWMRTPTDVRFPAGESYAELRRRVLAAVVTLRAAHRGETFAVVSHGGPIRAILADVLQLPDDAVFRLDLRYGGVSIVDWIRDTPLVRLVNAPAVAVGSRRRGVLPDPEPRLG